MRNCVLMVVPRMKSIYLKFILLRSKPNNINHHIDNGGISRPYKHWADK